MMFSPFRNMVDGHFPAIGRGFRLLRDLSWAGRHKDTPYGFSLAGDHRMSRSDWEPAETKAFVALLNSHDIVVDIGANVGLYSCLAAIQGKHVVAFEPSRRNLRFLSWNLWHNHLTKTEVYPIGLGSQPGLIPIYGFGGTASFVRGWGRASVRSAELVPVSTLDILLSGRFRDRPILIKMDVEGSELNILQGATETLQRSPHPTWLVEIVLADELVPGGINHNFARTFECFWEFGYECRTLNENFDLVTSETLKRWVAEGHVSSGLHDFLFRIAESA
jgi:FkbM family methyltransferase